MPGFLEDSGYDGTEQIDLGRGYWAEVKRCLSSKEASLTEAAMIGNHRLGDRGQSATISSRNYRTEMVVLSLVNWNLTDKDGTTWPLDGVTDKVTGNVTYSPGCLRRQSVARLPEPVFEVIFQRCDALNSPRAGLEGASFPVPPERGDQDGDAGTAGPGPVPDGTGVLDTTGPYEGDLAAASAS